MRLRLLLERICAQYGFGFFVQEKSKFVSSTASDRKGVAKGESVPLDRVLPTFARTKVGPRRVGVQMNTFCKTPRRRRRNKAGHSLCRQSLRFAPLTTSLYTREALGTCVQFMPLQKAPRRLRRLQSCLIQKFFYSLFISEKPPHRGRPKFPPGIVPPAAEYR